MSVQNFNSKKWDIRTQEGGEYTLVNKNRSVFLKLYPNKSNKAKTKVTNVFKSFKLYFNPLEVSPIKKSTITHIIKDCLKQLESEKLKKIQDCFENGINIKDEDAETIDLFVTRHIDKWRNKSGISEFYKIKFSNYIRKIHVFHDKKLYIMLLPTTNEEAKFSHLGDHKTLKLSMDWISKKMYIYGNSNIGKAKEFSRELEVYKKFSGIKGVPSSPIGINKFKLNTGFITYFFYQKKYALNLKEYIKNNEFNYKQVEKLAFGLIDILFDFEKKKIFLRKFSLEKILINVEKEEFEIKICGFEFLSLSQFKNIKDVKQLLKLVPKCNIPEYKFLLEKFNEWKAGKKEDYIKHLFKTFIFKKDVFSFGVILLELLFPEKEISEKIEGIISKSTVHEKNAEYFYDISKKIDKLCDDLFSIDDKNIDKFSKLIRYMLNPNPFKRLSIKEVYEIMGTQ